MSDEAEQIAELLKESAEKILEILREEANEAGELSQAMLTKAKELNIHPAVATLMMLQTARVLALVSGMPEPVFNVLRRWADTMAVTSWREKGPAIIAAHAAEPPPDGRLN